MYPRMTSGFCGSILNRVRLKERPAKRDLRLEAKDTASSETLLKRSDPLTFRRFSAACQEA